MSDMTVAKTILSQLGGNQFIAMTGAKSLAGDNTMLSFRIPRKGVTITLNGKDLYDITVIRPGTFRSGTWTETQTLGEAFDVGCDNLRETFTRLTGLHTKL